MVQQTAYSRRKGATRKPNALWTAQKSTGNDRELGYCSGIEKLLALFDGRKTRHTQFCGLDSFPATTCWSSEKPRHHARSGPWGGDRKPQKRPHRIRLRLLRADNGTDFQRVREQYQQAVFVRPRLRLRATRPRSSGRTNHSAHGAAGPPKDIDQVNQIADCWTSGTNRVKRRPVW